MSRKLHEILGERGLLAKVVGGYDWRPQQLVMAEAVGQALTDEQILLVEAPTGVGKTMAYLVPAALYARREREPVVVSSYTRTLQDQILLLEAPRLRRLIHPDLRIVSLKGRSNYLCRRRWDMFVAEEGSGPDGRRVIDRLEGWVQTTKGGDFAEAPDLGRRGGWALRRIGGDARFCRSRACHPDRGCFHKRARREARQAELVVVNHSLLLADALGAGILPEHRALIVDEAHLLPEAAIEPLSVRVGELGLTERLRGMGGTGEPGFSDRLRRVIRRLPGKVAMRNLTRRLRQLESDSREALSAARAFFDALRTAPGYPREGERRRYGHGELPLDAFLPAETDALLEGLERLVTAAGELLAATGEEVRSASPEIDEILDGAAGNLAELEEARLKLTELLGAGGTERVYCQEASRREGILLAGLPIETGPPLREHLLRGVGGLVLTSATLATGEDFSFFARQVGLERDEGERLRLASPFPLERQLLTLVPRAAVDPRQEGYIDFLVQTLARIIRSVARKTLVLFTSYDALRQVHAGLQASGLPPRTVLLAQSRAGTRGGLMSAFRAPGHAVLLGTASFWHGVDFPGEELELLVVTRLPFPVPSDPRVAAIGELLETAGRSSFREHALPEAVLRFRQGHGRLIRRRGDRGVCVILDPRVVSARYGEAFREVLPTPPVVVADGDDLARQVGAWLSREPGAEGEPRAGR
ncbi:MAG: hypothetical protein KAY32_10250 [Candidatus Eisenbacteria sp.]|nr:hypothetical protein [Candidatus Eisenbacteria bacterium]